MILHEPVSRGGAPFRSTPINAIEFSGAASRNDFQFAVRTVVRFGRMDSL